MTIREWHSEWPGLEHYADTPIFNTKSVAQQTGVAAPTLRAWERRYTMLAPERAENTYRLYSERDIATIRWLKERVDGGMSISQATTLLRYLADEHHKRASNAAPTQHFSPTFPLHIPMHTPILEEQAEEQWTQHVPVEQSQQKAAEQSYSPTTFGGQVFAQQPDLIPQVPGTYIDGDLPGIVDRLRRIAFEQMKHMR